MGTADRHSAGSAGAPAREISLKIPTYRLLDYVGNFTYNMILNSALKGNVLYMLCCVCGVHTVHSDRHTSPDTQHKGHRLNTNISAGSTIA